MRVNTRVTKVAFLAVIAFVGIIAFKDMAISALDDRFFQQNFDLTTISGRELASISKDVSPYKPKKCGEVKHTDGTIMTFCIASFSGTTGGFYNPAKELMVVGSFNQYTLIHEITHATTLHYYKDGVDITSPEFQEKIAYNSENLLMQIIAFKEGMNITKDISDEKKIKLGIPVADAKAAIANLQKQTKVTTKTVSLKTVKVGKELA
jgi:hypothetical protein